MAMIGGGITGTYSESFTWLQRSTTRDTSTGADVEDFTSNGTLWGSIEPSTGQESMSYGDKISQSVAIIKLRQFPAVSALDRLLHKRSGLTYDITGRYVNWLANEVVLQATVFDSVDRIDQ